MDFSATTSVADKVTATDGEEIAPEILVAIAAAITVFLGRKFRLLSVSHPVQVSRWTKQGRAFVQASHNVRKKR